MKDRSPYFATLLVILSALGAIGCSTKHATNKHLQEVAKDWCRTIRASQVLPVYPLTEDLQPGDVFLVNIPIQDQQREWEQKGYLQLDNHVTRLLPAPDYAEFYGIDRYAIDGRVHPPAHWQFPSTGQNGSTNWAAAPRAAFPSYSFSVSRSGGLNVGIPVQGVPVGLNLLGSSSATGTVTIADAYTYGADIKQVEDMLLVWAKRPDVQGFLKAFPPRDTGRKNDADKAIYDYSLLRVVTRVYLTGRVNVSLYTGRAGGGTLSAGEKRPVESLVIGAGNPSATTNIEKVNRLLRGETASAEDAKPANTPNSGGPTAESSGTGDDSVDKNTPDTSGDPSGEESDEPEEPSGETPNAPARSTSQPSPSDSAAPSTGTPTPKPKASQPSVAPVAAAASNVSQSGAAAFKPGGSVQVSAASSRSISLNETFARPLVIGYLGFDVTIEKDGKLGQIYSTLNQLENRPQLPSEVVSYDPEDPYVRPCYKWLRDNSAKLRAWMDSHDLANVAFNDFCGSTKYRDQRAAAAVHMEAK